MRKAVIVRPQLFTGRFLREMMIMPKLSESEKRSLCFNLAMSYLQAYPESVERTDPDRRVPTPKHYAQMFFTVERDMREIVEAWEKGTLKASP